MHSIFLEQIQIFFVGLDILNVLNIFICLTDEKNKLGDLDFYIAYKMYKEKLFPYNCKIIEQKLHRTKIMNLFFILQLWYFIFPVKKISLSVYAY